MDSFRVYVRMSGAPKSGTMGTLKVGTTEKRMKFIGTVNKGYGTGNLSFAGAGASSLRKHWTFVSEEAQGNFKNYPLNEKGKSWDFTPNAPTGNKAANTRRRRTTRKRRATRKSRR